MDDEYNEDREGSIAAVIDAVERLAPIETISPDPEGPPAFVLSRMTDGRVEVTALKPYWDALRDRPERIVGKASHTRLASFIAHLNRFKSIHSAVFAHDDPASPYLLGVIDYHEGNYLSIPAGETEATRVAGLPRFGKHRSVYTFPLSDEWKAWHAIAAKGFFDQSDLAAFLEEHLADVLDPNAATGESIVEFCQTHGAELAGPARLASLARGLTLHVDHQVSNVSDPDTGEATLHYAEAHRASDGGPLKVPRAFAIAIQVTRAGAFYQIPVRLRYRVRRGAIAWSIDLHRTERIFAHAFDEACVQVQTETDLPVFFGSPE